MKRTRLHGDEYNYLGHFAEDDVLDEGHNTQWIKRAIKRPGAFTAKARRAGKSVAEFAEDVTRPGSGASTRTKRQARLAQTLRRLAKRR
jgi:hypothetical protein